MSEKEKEVKIKEITIMEFRAWLQGVEEMQEDDWHPNETQWKKIRGKIDCVIQGVQPVAPSGFVPQQPQQIIQNFQPDRSALDNVPMPVPIQLNPNAPMNKVEGEQVKTPNIDTSDGNYTSTFE